MESRTHLLNVSLGPQTTYSPREGVWVGAWRVGLQGGLIGRIVQKWTRSCYQLSLGLRTPLPVVAFWVYIPGQNDTHSRIAVLFPVHMVGFNRLGDPKKSPKEVVFVLL